VACGQLIESGNQSNSLPDNLDDTATTLEKYFGACKLAEVGAKSAKVVKGS
jgi:hypothetical protein